MRRKLIVAAVAASALLGTAAAVALSSAPAGAAAGGSGARAWGSAGGRDEGAGRPVSNGVRTLVFKATTLRLRTIDVDGDGRDDAGDYVVFTESLAGRMGTTAKGSDSVRCTLNSRGHGDTLSMCDGEFIVQGLGQITVYGLASPWVAVTGGTGSFSGARGEAKIITIDPRSEMITITLTT